MWQKYPYAPPNQKNPHSLILLKFSINNYLIKIFFNFKIIIKKKKKKNQNLISHIFIYIYIYIKLVLSGGFLLHYVRNFLEAAMADLSLSSLPFKSAILLLFHLQILFSFSIIKFFILFSILCFFRHENPQAI